MRKCYMLIVSLALISLLLTGCLGTRTSYIYDGSPTALEVVIKRDGASVATMSDEPEQYVNVRIWKTNESGQVIYSVIRQIPINEITGSGYSLSEQVPADKGYNVTAMYDGDGILEVGESIANAPAEMITSTELTISPLEFVLHKPDPAYSGGTMNQFWVEFLELGNTLSYSVRLASAPWTENNGKGLQIPEGGSAWITSISPTVTNRIFPEVTEPIKIYYQVFISSANQQLQGGACYPDLTMDTELPFVWLYPSPNQAPQ